MDLLKPSVADKVETAQARQKFQHDQRSKSRSFEVGDAVQVRNYSGNQKWSYETAVELNAQVLYLSKNMMVPSFEDTTTNC